MKESQGATSLATETLFLSIPEERCTRKTTFRALMVVVVILAIAEGLKSQGKDSSMSQQVFYRTVKVDGLSIFYREAGPKDAPTILLLHGLPSSSRMFQPLLTRLADDYHLVAPDYPGFGHSDWPDAKQFDYTFDHIASVMNDFTQAIGLSKYMLYMQDYGGPVGFRVALGHPERVQALIVQDAVAHNEGLGANWATRRAFWADARRTKRHCEKICFRSIPRKLAISVTIPGWNSTTPISGSMNTGS